MARGDMLTGIIRELRGNDECRYAGGESRRRKATRVLPPVELRERTLADDERRRRASTRGGWAGPPGRARSTANAECRRETSSDTSLRQDAAATGGGETRAKPRHCHLRLAGRSRCGKDLVARRGGRRGCRRGWSRPRGRPAQR